MKANFIAPPVFLVVFLVTWQLLTAALGVPAYLLPAPSDIFTSFVEESEKVLKAMLVTGLASILGLAISFCVSQVIAIVFTLSPLVRISCYPYAILLQTVPVVAIAPILITWCGYGFGSVVIVAAVISLFPMITATTNGLLSVDAELVELFTLYRADWRQVLFQLRYPHAMRYLITGLKTSCGLAVVGAIVGEYFVGHHQGQEGLGYYLFITSQQMKTPFLFVNVLASTVLGVMFFAVITVLAQTILLRYYDPTSLRGPTGKRA